MTRSGWWLGWQRQRFVSVPTDRAIENAVQRLAAALGHQPRALEVPLAHDPREPLRLDVRVLQHAAPQPRTAPRERQTFWGAPRIEPS